MIAAAIPTPSGPCFATYHPAQGPALLMLPLFGYEAIATYRHWRDLAETLAAQGTAVLRLDLPGTGDSSGAADMPAPVASCQAAIDAALGWLAERHGTVSLLGCRFGALLALDAVGRGAACETLLLLDPPADGAALARQLRARARLEPGGGDDRRAYGVPLTDAMLTGLAPLPATGKPAPPRVLLIGPPAAAPAWLAALQAAGSQIETMPFEDRDAFVMRNSFQHEAPRAAFDRILLTMAGEARTVAVLPVEPSGMELSGMREEPVRFGPGLFGLLCLPSRRREVAALIPSIANLPRSGPGRSSVLLARRLAAEGFASLRYDSAGVGDSDGVSEGDRAVATYGSEHIGHIPLALDALAAHGFRRAVVLGHCSGAYLAWHAADADPRIVGVFAMNMQVLAHMDAATAAATVRPGGTPAPGAAPAMPSRPSPLGALKRRVQDACPPWLWDRLRAMSPTEAGVRRHLARLLRRGSRVHFVYGDEEDEQYRFHRAFGRKPRLPRGAEVTVLQGADHLFAAAGQRARLFELAARFVASHEPVATEGRGRA